MGEFGRELQKGFLVKENGEDERELALGMKVGKIHQDRGGFCHMFFKVYPKTLGR